MTLPEVRAMTDLAKTVDRRVERLTLLPSDDSSIKDEGVNFKHSAVESPPPSRSLVNDLCGCRTQYSGL